jgi:DNA-binding NarL/FixJ family response regulator
VIAEDQALLREGIVALLRENGVDVVAQAEDGDGLLRIVGGHKPDIAIVDVRLPPGFSDEGVRAAIEARRRQPGLAILILSQYVEQTCAAELFADGRGGVGYLLKDRVADVTDFVDSVKRVAEGGTALDPEAVAQLLVPAGPDDPLAGLTPREMDVMQLMAEGRTNHAIAHGLHISESAVEKHVSTIFGKLALPRSEDDHRRVMAVAVFLRRASSPP